MKSKNTAKRLENVWLARNPSKNRCIHDNGDEFIGNEFQNMLLQNKIDLVSYKFKEESIPMKIEENSSDRSRWYPYNIKWGQSKIENYKKAEQLMVNALATCLHSDCFAVNHMIQTSSGASLFWINVFLDIKFISDLILIRNRREQLIDQNLVFHNQRQYDFHNKVGKEVIRFNKSEIQGTWTI